MESTANQGLSPERGAGGGGHARRAPGEANDASPAVVVHLLKTPPVPFKDVASGQKRFEIRKDDRTPPFERGHVVVLREYEESRVGGYSGGKLIRRIGYTLRGHGVPDGYCAFELLTAFPEDDARVALVLGDIVVSL